MKVAWSRVHPYGQWPVAFSLRAVAGGTVACKQLFALEKIRSLAWNYTELPGLDDLNKQLMSESRNFTAGGLCLDAGHELVGLLHQQVLLRHRGQLAEQRENLGGELTLFRIFFWLDHLTVLNGFGIIDADIVEHVDNGLRLVVIGHFCQCHPMIARHQYNNGQRPAYCVEKGKSHE